MASSSNSKTIPELAKRLLKDLFKQQSEPDSQQSEPDTPPDSLQSETDTQQSKAAPLPGQWCTLTPKEMDSLDCTPSQSSKFYLIKDGCEEEVKEHLENGFESIFNDVAHVETFWEEFCMNLSHKLGLTYREAQKMNGMTYNEAKLKHHILHPILTEVSKAACIHPQIGDGTVRTNYVVEEDLDIASGKPGQKPSVDAVIQVSSINNKILALVPVEMKVDMDTKNYSQIACYINMLISAKEVRDHVMVGIIIDNKQFRLAFSVFCNCDRTIPLPIVHISPPIAWKSYEHNSIDEPSMLALACTFLIGQLQRLEYPSRSTQKKKPSVSLADLEEMGKKNCEHPVVLSKPEIERLGLLPLKRQIDEQQEEIKKLKKTIETLKPVSKRGRRSRK